MYVSLQAIEYRPNCTLANPPPPPSKESDLYDKVKALIGTTKEKFIADCSHRLDEDTLRMMLEFYELPAKKKEEMDDKIASRPDVLEMAELMDANHDGIVSEEEVTVKLS